MPLDVKRLRDSDLAAIASDDEFRAAVLLWCAAWHQVPAGSLPDDDRVLAHLIGFGRNIDKWKEIKEMALRGFQLCRDGRLYHVVLCEKVREAWERKENTADAREANRKRLKQWRQQKRLKKQQLRNADETNSETDVKRERSALRNADETSMTGTGIKEKKIIKEKLIDLLGWEPDQDDLAYAREQSVDPRRILEDIQDWAANAAPAKRRKREPKRFWQGWCRREADKLLSQNRRTNGRDNRAGRPGDDVQNLSREDIESTIRMWITTCAHEGRRDEWRDVFREKCPHLVERATEEGLL